MEGGEVFCTSTLIELNLSLQTPAAGGASIVHGAICPTGAAV
jgi:hypothetical protein